VFNILLLGSIGTTVLAVRHLEVGIIGVGPNPFNGLGSVADGATGNECKSAEIRQVIPLSLLKTYKLTKAAFLGGRKLICSISI
jgi:hypothetical protein